MKTSYLFIGLFIAASSSLLFFSCEKENKLPFEATSVRLPATPFQYVNNVSASNNNLNPTTNNGATLGRVLFYDKNLSLNNSIACASCHKQERGFADVGSTSVGFRGEKTTRNSMSLANPGLDARYFWDMRSSTLEDLVLQPIGNHIEMGLDNTENMVKKLKKTSFYPELFKAAFGTYDITEDRISKALAQFVRSLVSFDSKFDQATKSWGSNTLTGSELEGWNLFFNQLHCSGCHDGNNLNQRGFGQNIGLDNQYADNGMGKQMGDANLNGVFKVPTLRNVALTAPYMHDGRFKTLEEVVEHYNSGIKNHKNLSKTFRGFLWMGNGGNSNGGTFTQGCWSCGIGQGGDDFKNLNMTDQQKSDLVAFLKSLTDERFVSDVKFSNPFVQ